MGGRTLAEIGAGRATGHGSARPLRQALLAVCLAAAALAGDDRPAGASQLFKPGHRSEASRPQTLRLLSDGILDRMAVRVEPFAATE